MRIAIVNDMKMAVEALRRALLSVAGYEVAWVAETGAEAVRHCAADVPDLILMDIVMPEMDGIEATRQIMAKSPCAILVVTASVTHNVSQVFQAMGAGALDAVSTPTFGDGQGDEELLRKVKTIGRLLDANGRIPRIRAAAAADKHDRWLFAIGSSTGGPAAIAKIISRLPADFSAAIVVIQHVDEKFAPGLVEWLSQQSPLPVRLAKEGDRIEQGVVLVAGTNDHLYIKPDGTLGYKVEPAATPYRPSVDVFFDSVAANWKGHCVATLLTGMGRDGAEGLLGLRKNGLFTIAQDAETCAVYGMPKAAAELNAAIKILPIDAIADSMLGYMAEHGRVRGAL